MVAPRTGLAVRLSRRTLLVGLGAVLIGACVASREPRPPTPAPYSGAAPPEHLFPILQDGRHGFMAPDGTVVVVPQFVAVGEFVDGLALAETIDLKFG